MTVALAPFLEFVDCARPAMEFYRSVFGGTLHLSTFGEFETLPDLTHAGRIMHAELRTDSGLVLMASDTLPGAARPSASGSVALFGDDAATIHRYWEGLTEDGQIDMPLAEAPWGDTFGMCTDRFGVAWMLSTTPTRG